MTECVRACVCVCSQASGTVTVTVCVRARALTDGNGTEKPLSKVETPALPSTALLPAALRAVKGPDSQPHWPHLAGIPKASSPLLVKGQVSIWHIWVGRVQILAELKSALEEEPR